MLPLVFVVRWLHGATPPPFGSVVGWRGFGARFGQWPSRSQVLQSIQRAQSQTHPAPGQARAHGWPPCRVHPRSSVLRSWQSMHAPSASQRTPAPLGRGTPARRTAHHHPTPLPRHHHNSQHAHHHHPTPHHHPSIHHSAQSSIHHNHHITSPHPNPPLH